MHFPIISKNPGRAIVLILSAMLFAVPPSPASGLLLRMTRTSEYLVRLMP
jgi:hypothetical protein